MSERGIRLLETADGRAAGDLGGLEQRRRSARNSHGPDAHDGDHSAESVGLDGVLERLSAGRDIFSFLPELSDERLDTVPPAGCFRFCDGQRTLEQVVVGLLKHQGHQVAAIQAAVA